MSEPLYLEDIVVGQRFGTGTVAVDLDSITAFAAAFDPQPFHLDEAAARNSLFGGLVASGWAHGRLDHEAAGRRRLPAGRRPDRPRGRPDPMAASRPNPATSCASRAKCWRCGIAIQSHPRCCQGAEHDAEPGRRGRDDPGRQLDRAAASVPDALSSSPRGCPIGQDPDARGAHQPTRTHSKRAATSSGRLS